MNVPLVMQVLCELSYDAELEYINSDVSLLNLKSNGWKKNHGIVFRIVEIVP